MLHDDSIFSKIGASSKPGAVQALSRTRLGLDKKIHSHEDTDLLESVVKEWRSNKVIPLFVSEGTKEQKIAAIQSSHYLSTVYWEVISEPREILTIYGWDIGEQDEHILQRLKNSNIKKFAISVYDKNTDYMEHAQKTIRKIIGNVEIRFFDSESPGCWIHPPQPQ